MELLDIPQGRPAAHGGRDQGLPEARRRLRQLAEQHQVLRAEYTEGPAGVAARQAVPGHTDPRTDLVSKKTRAFNQA